MFQLTDCDLAGHGQHSLVCFPNVMSYMAEWIEVLYMCFLCFPAAMHQAPLSSAKYSKCMLQSSLVTTHVANTALCPH